MIRELIKQIIKEEIGRDYKTTIDIMMDYRRLPGIDVQIVSIPSQGGFKVTVTDENQPQNTRSGFFKDYQEAGFFAKKEAMKIYNSNLSKDTSLTVSDEFGPMGRGVEGRT